MDNNELSGGPIDFLARRVFGVQRSLETPAKRPCRAVSTQSGGRAILARIMQLPTKSNALVAASVTGALCREGGGIYKTREGKTTAHRLCDVSSFPAPALSAGNRL